MVKVNQKSRNRKSVKFTDSSQRQQNHDYRKDSRYKHKEELENLSNSDSGQSGCKADDDKLIDKSEDGVSERSEHSVQVAVTKSTKNKHKTYRDNLKKNPEKQAKRRNAQKIRMQKLRLNKK